MSLELLLGIIQLKWQTNGHHVFDLSRFSEVKSNFPPHLKIELMLCPNYGRNFMLSTGRAQFLEHESLTTPLYNFVSSKQLL